MIPCERSAETIVTQRDDPRGHRLDFLIVGAQKSGTTALQRRLATTPGIQMSGQKELHFFDNEQIDWSVPTYENLHMHFDWGDPCLVRGEATPITSYWPGSLERAHTYSPNLKLVFLIRHPSYRAYSHWLMERARGNENLSFVDAISDSGRTRVRNARYGVHRVFSYIERGAYSEQASRILALFPRHQLFIATLDDLWEQPVPTLTRLGTFLGVSMDVSPLPRTPAIKMRPNDRPPMRLRDRKIVDQILHDEIQAHTLGQLGVLTPWATPGYVDPLYGW